MKRIQSLVYTENAAMMTTAEVLRKVESGESFHFSEILTITYSDGAIVKVTDQQKIRDILEKVSVLTREIDKLVAE